MAEEKTEEKANKKMKSRKFIVWLMATIFQAVSFVLIFTNKDTTLAVQFMPWWGGISMIYIGGNVAQKFVEDKAK